MTKEDMSQNVLASFLTVTSNATKSSQAQARQRFPMPGASYLIAASPRKNVTQF